MKPIRLLTRTFYLLSSLRCKCIRFSMRRRLSPVHFNGTRARAIAHDSNTANYECYRLNLTRYSEPLSLQSMTYGTVLIMFIYYLRLPG